MKFQTIQSAFCWIVFYLVITQEFIKVWYFTFSFLFYSSWNVSKTELGGKWDVIKSWINKVREITELSKWTELARLRDHWAYWAYLETFLWIWEQGMTFGYWDIKLLGWPLFVNYKLTINTCKGSIYIQILKYGMNFQKLVAWLQQAVSWTQIHSNTHSY